jgi:hypothetical protein
LADGTPKNQAPGTLKAKGEPGRAAATAMRIVPTRPASTDAPYRPEIDARSSPERTGSLIAVAISLTFRETPED